MILDVRARFDDGAERFDEDPALGTGKSRKVSEAMMGDIVRCADGEVTFAVEAVASAPIERLEIRNGIETLETVRPYGEADLGKRIRVIFEGSEYRGRGRQTIWDGGAKLSGNRIERLQPINFYNLEKTVDQPDDTTLSWKALTTGGFVGFDLWLADRDAGSLSIETALVQCQLEISDIGLEDSKFEAGGIGRRVRVFRLPDDNGAMRLDVERRIALKSGADDALYVCLTQEDGHQVWSSPIYVIE